MTIRRRRAAGLIVLTLVATLILPACTDDDTIRVFAASSLQDVLPEMLDAYTETHPGDEIEVQFGGSQALATQIELGASATLFLSANQLQVDRLDDDDLVANRTPIASNRLVIAVAAHSPFERLEDLADDGVRVAIGAPDVPVGALTARAFAALDEPLREAIRANVVTEDPNVRVVLSRVELGAVDAAFVYLTDAIAGDDLREIELPFDLAPNVYVGALLDGAPSRAADLLAFIASDATDQIWRDAGFEAVSAP